MILGLISGIIWFAAFLIGHVALVHWGNPDTRSRWANRLLVSGASGIVLTLLSIRAVKVPDVFHQGGWWMGALWGELSYFGLYCIYTPFYYVIVASLSVRSMVMLIAQPGQELTLEQMRKEFASSALVRQRLATMAANGYLLREGERYVLTSKGRFVARAFACLKYHWNLGSGG